MEEGMRVILRILFVLLVVIAVLVAVYYLKDVLYEKTSMIKDIFSNLF